MELVVIRHAIAVERSPELDDAERPLTERGRRRFRRVARALRRLEVEVDLVLASPWLRARDTAAMLKKVTDGRRLPVLTQHLVGPPRADLLSVIAASGVNRVAVVGHEPWLGELIAMLTTGEARHGEALPLRKGGVAILDGTPAPAGMELRAFLPPDLLARLGTR